MRTVLFGMEDLAAFIIVSINSFTISFKSSIKKICGSSLLLLAIAYITL